MVRRIPGAGMIDIQTQRIACQSTPSPLAWHPGCAASAGGPYPRVAMGRPLVFGRD